MCVIYVCEDHIDIGIEQILDLNNMPIVETVESVQCSRCDKQAQYKISAGDEFED